MSIPEKTLKEWRKKALKCVSGAVALLHMYKGTAEDLASCYVECQEHILRLTQELLDQILLEEKK